MTQEIATEIEIDGPASRAWEVLADFAQYPRWNPFIVKVKGVPEEGERISFWVALPHGFHAPARATILKADAQRELRWAGRLPGLLRAEHYHVIQQLGVSKIRFLHGELFSGLAAPIIWPLLRTQGRAIYEDVNVALKTLVEQGPWWKE